MTPERWQQIDELFPTAVELEPGQRAAFLDDVSAGDKALRARVEAMLTSDADDWETIEKPALELAASFLADDQPQLAPGQHIAHYEIVSLIGRGGMGEVYQRSRSLVRRADAYIEEATPPIMTHSTPKLPSSLSWFSIR